MKQRGAAVGELRTARLACLLALAVVSCGGRGSRTPAPSVAPAPEVPVAGAEAERALLADAPDGLVLQLTPGRAGAPAADRTAPAPARKLTEAETGALLARTPPLAAEPGDAQPFALRPGPQVPRAEQLAQGSFPPPPGASPPAPTVSSGGLSVLRVVPQGAVPLAPELTVTFSQPMVAVSSQDQARAVAPPVKLTPQPPGKWRWLGTRTAIFEPEGGRFPQATTYRVEIAAGARSVDGQALAQAAVSSFETPPPQVIASYPDSTDVYPPDIPMFVLFDQKVDPAAALASIKVRPHGQAPLALRQLEGAEISRHPALSDLVAKARANGQDGRWLAFRATAELPKDASIEVQVGPGTPSREGPGKAAASHEFKFQTYPPLRVTANHCGYLGKCPAGSPLVVSFSTPLDGAKIDPSMLRVTPALAGDDAAEPDFHVDDNDLWLRGDTRANTTYTMVISGKVQDLYGQTLGQDQTVTFQIRGAEPRFVGASGMVVLDPSLPQRTFDVFTTSYEALKVALYRVEPKDLEAYLAYELQDDGSAAVRRLPGRKVVDRLLPTGKDRDSLVKTTIDLAPALKDGLGHVVVVVEPYPWTEKGSPPQLLTWVQATQLGVDASVDSDTLHAFVSELATGAPAAGVQLELVPHRLSATSDAAGLAQLRLPAKVARGHHTLVARRGKDSALLMEDRYWDGENGGWRRYGRTEDLRWYVVDDRQLYQPGEEVSLKGYLRVVDLGKGGDVGWRPGQVTKVRYEMRDAADGFLLRGSIPVSAQGSFDARLRLPKQANLGEASLVLEVPGRWTEKYTHDFRIEEVRRPEFEVSAQASAGPHLVGERAEVTVSARYFTGAPLPGAPVSWRVTAAPAAFVPPNRDDYVFGQWHPWWLDDAGEGDLTDEDGTSWTLDGTSDGAGTHTLQLAPLSVRPVRPMRLTASASVLDVNRQLWSASAPVLVHPSALYVGVRTAQPFVERGTPMKLDVIAVDLDGKAAPGARIDVQVARLSWRYERGEYKTLEVEPQRCALVSADGPMPCEVKTDRGGEYQVTATITDGRGRPNQTRLTFWVAGGEQAPELDLEHQDVKLVPDKREYRAGDTAQVLVQAPFYPAHGVVSWRRSGIVRTERLELTGPTTTIQMPITDAMVPNLTVQVELVGAEARPDARGQPDPAAPRRPAYATGALSLSVPPVQRTLAVTVTPAAARLAPGDQTQVAVQVKDFAGKPVPGAEVAVLVVDEAVLSLLHTTFAEPVRAFYAARDAGARDFYLRDLVKGSVRDFPGEAAGGFGERGELMQVVGHLQGASIRKLPDRREIDLMDVDTYGGLMLADAPITVRQNLTPLAAFVPAVTTGADGAAQVSVKLPDNLTRYRIVALAAAGERSFGKGESALTARLPLMVRPSPPRFLNFGDTFQLPVVVQNQTDAPMTVQVAVRASNAALTDGAGRQVLVPANDRVEVRFPAAAQQAGTARFQVVAAAVGAAAQGRDAAELALPVWTPATTEAFATYGVLDGAAGVAMRQAVELPGKVVPQLGGLEVTTSSTQLQALTEAFLYLVAYPFECAEQRASRVLAIAALRDVLTAFSAKGLPSPSALQARVAADVERLQRLQNEDGGFPFWTRGDPSWPYLTAYVTHALVHAKAKGYAVPQQVLDSAATYLRGIERHYAGFYPQDVRWSISAFALAVRRQAGEVDVAKVKQLIKDAGVDRLSMEATGWLLQALAGRADAQAERQALLRHAAARVSETAGAAHFVTGYQDGRYLLLASDRRVDAVMLDALMREDKDSDLIPKLVTGLLAHRTAGRWESTQENTFALVALDRYFQTYEKVTPDFVARVWLGQGYAGDHAFKGRGPKDRDGYQLAIPMTALAAGPAGSGAKTALTIQKDGAGRLYYRVGMTYAPAALTLAAADYGFAVERRYEAVDAPGDVTRLPDGTWKIKAGAMVRVRLSMASDSRRYHVALVDPLPAGLEPLNPALAVTGPVPLDPKQPAAGWWQRSWYEHQNLRDERAEAFASLLWEGVYSYDYVARATTPGRFVVPPARAEEMYSPETFGRSASDRVIVE